MMTGVDHIDGLTFHGRKGAVENAFTYSVDYVLLDAEADVRMPRLFSRNKRGFFSLFDTDHGGAPHHGRGAAWVRDVLREHKVDFSVGRIELLAQPRVFQIGPFDNAKLYGTSPGIYPFFGPLGQLLLNDISVG